MPPSETPISSGLPAPDALERQVASFSNNLLAIAGDAARQVGKTIAYDVFEVTDWPTNGRVTYISAGFSALLMPSLSAGVMGHELALPLVKESSAVDPLQFMESFGDYLLDRRVAVNDREFFPIDLDETDELGGVYVRIGKFLPKSIDHFYKAIPVTVLELFLLDRAASGAVSTDGFARDFEAGLIRPMNWSTKRIY